MSDSGNSSREPASAVSEAGVVLAERYEIIRELGRGGMGVVYLCKDLVSGERVALKRLKPPEEQKGDPRPEETWWFQQEARAVASLDHPALVRARDFGTLEEGSPYLVMDALPGRSVHEWMYTTKMPWPVVWALVDQVLAGLAHAHARGVIHGDLKPSNIMLDLATPGRGPRAYILDLGLAWLRQTMHDPRLDGAPEPELATHAGAGTVGWVAPEQIRKAATLVGPPTDLYALGCILYRVIVGREVFEGTAQEVLRAHKRTPVQPFRVPEGMPRQVDAFVRRLLAKRPWHRFEFAADARRDWAKIRPRQTYTLEETVATAPAPPVAPSSAPALGQAVEAGRSLAPGLLGLRPPPLAGRERERRELLTLIDGVCNPGGNNRQFVALIGEAGVGKSRLASWLTEYVHEHGLMIPLRARYGRISSPLDGITGATNAFLNLAGADRALVEQTLMSRWEVAPNDDDALTWVAATAEWLRPTPPGTVPPLGPSGKRFVLDTAELRWAVVRHVLERIGEERPILLWLDDLHYASPNTFEVLSRLRSVAPGLRLMVIATARSETLATDLDAALRMEQARAEWNGRVLELRPLDSEETQALLRSTLPLRDEAVQRATEQSRGNPLFALQLLHAWAGGGFLRLERGGRYRVPDAALMGRAITTAELWDERLRAVPTDLRLAAYAAAALGDDIRGRVLRALVDSLGMDDRDALVALTRAQILLATGNDQFRWPHTLLLEHLLSRLQERHDAPAIFRLAANALAKHPAVGSRRIMKHRVSNLLRAGDDEVAARLMFQYIANAWRRGRDTAATLRDLRLLKGHVVGWAEAEYLYWRAEALRHTGRLLQAKREAEDAREAFQAEGAQAREAHTLRLLGHIASDMGRPADGRTMVVDSLERFRKLKDDAGLAQSQVVLGEIDYLLGEHARARELLREARDLCIKADDHLGHAQCLLLLAMIATAVGAFRRSRELLEEARSKFDEIGYRLGLAQCDVVLAHADFRAFELDSARSRALSARQACRQLQNPRGEAACERLLAMIAIDADDFSAARAHASVARQIYEKLHDSWGDVETLLLLAQVSLAEGAIDASDRVAACDAVDVDEAEPRQHRHLTRAWLAHSEGRWEDAAREIDGARTAFGERERTADHTPQLVQRLLTLEWPSEIRFRLEDWAATLARQNADGSPSLHFPPNAG